MLVDVSYTSVIDHFFWNANIEPNILDAGVIHLPGNMSDHSPIYCVLHNNTITKVNSNCKTPISKPSWKNASDKEREMFFTKLSQNLDTLDIPEEANCCNTNCDRTMHKNAIDNYMLNILCAMEHAATESLPKPKVSENTRKPIPRWNEDIEPSKQDALFWHAIWVSAGKPLNNELHKIMKRTRNIYHLNIRKNKRMMDKVKRDKLLNACLNNKSGIFSEIKAMRRTKPSFSDVIDGNSDNIPEYFALKYKTLYNSVDDEKELSTIKNETSERIKTSDVCEVSRITPLIMKEASRKLTSNKRDPIFDIASDFLTNAPDILYIHLSNLMKSFVIHGHLSRTLAICTLLPIIKDKLGKITDSNNYRSIAISSVILKLFDWVIILLYKDNLHLDSLQFSYQQDCSTTMCTWMVIETIDYFLRNDTEIFICTMDMTKAFDNVKHSLLFKKLLQRGIPAIILRFIMYMYEIQMAFVRWNGEISEEFKINNGVKQGAVLSALLYCVYVDDLFHRLRRDRIGCSINGEYVGILGYADDNILLSPTLDGLQQMIKVCEQYAKEHNLTFSTNENISKCKIKCMAFLTRKRYLRPMVLCEHNLPWVNSIRHLGNKIENKLDGMKQDMKEKKARFIQKNNEICQEFSFAEPIQKAKLNQIYNSHFTGSSLWDLFCNEAESVGKTWNVAIRKMLGLDRRTHRYFIEPLSRQQHITWSLNRRFINFTHKIATSLKTPLKILFNTIKKDCKSVTGKNLRHIMLLLGVNNIADITTNACKSMKYHIATEGEEKTRLDMVKELIDVKRNNCHLQYFESNEIDEMITYLCTT